MLKRHTKETWNEAFACVTRVCEFEDNKKVWLQSCRMSSKKSAAKQQPAPVDVGTNEYQEVMGLIESDVAQTGSYILSPAQVRLVCSNGYRPRDVPTFRSASEKNAFVNAVKFEASMWAKNQPAILADGKANPNVRLSNGIAWEILVGLGIPEEELSDPKQTGMGDFNVIWQKAGFKGTPWDIAAIHLSYPNIPLQQLKTFTREQANKAYNAIKAKEDAAKSTFPGSSSDDGSGGSDGSAGSKRSRGD